MRKLVIVLVVQFLIIISLSINVQANINTNPSTAQSIDTDQYASIIANLKISPLREQENGGKILCFDVREDGSFVLGFDSLPRKVCVFDNNGTFQYGFSFSDYGTYGVTLIDTGVLIHMVRSSICVEINPDIEVLTVSEIPPTLENNNYWQEITSQNSKKINEKTYMLKDNHKLISLDSKMNETILYETESIINLHTILPVFLLVACFSVLSALCKVLFAKKTR